VQSSSIMPLATLGVAGSKDDVDMIVKGVLTGARVTKGSSLAAPAHRGGYLADRRVPQPRQALKGILELFTEVGGTDERRPIEGRFFEFDAPAARQCA